MAENPKQQQVRRPGSQVAPGQKPFFRPGQTASTHSRVSIEAATAGKLYRVRDRADASGNATVWGELLTYEDAKRLKEKVVTARRSRTARLEEMTADEIAAAQGAEVEPAAAASSEAQAPAPPDYTKFDDVNKLYDALGDNGMRWGDAFCQFAAARGIRLSKDDEKWVAQWFTDAIWIRARPLGGDKTLAPVMAKAIAAVAPVARQAQARHDSKRIAVKSAPPTPPPSPLTDELVDVGDGPAELPPDEDAALDSSDVQDLTADVGGGPSADDAARACAQAERDIEEMTVAAKSAYDEATTASDAGPWPTWESLGAYEHAAWRYYVQNGGNPPALVKEPRKVGHAMGAVP
jgi:hypothetical protein